VRLKRILLRIAVFNLSRKRPQVVKKLLLGQVREALGEDYDIKTHFTPNYDPWDQRLCAVPEGDLFTAIAEKRAEVVTDHVDYFTPTGIHLKSGRDLDADIIVLATGLTMKFIGGTTLIVDGTVVDPSTLYVYRGMMLSNIPNLVQVFGYTNASWTLKSDLTGQYVCRLLNHMRKTGTTMAVPKVAPAGVEEEPMLDFSSGYILRAVEEFPKQGKKLPWRVYQNFIIDFISLRLRPIADTVLKFK
jgi:cation diffusion facilitator CzcD-associated flavoprotein CzcO